MSDRDESRGVDRRQFMGALGAAALGAVLPGANASEAPETHWYLDSFGNVVPVSPAAVAAGVVPPFPAGYHQADHESGDAKSSAAQPLLNPNILIIMVDQMREPKWFPSGPNGPSLYAAQLPNITNIAQHSFTFPNYYVAATSCIPSRAAILTGLYAPQTCMFVTPSQGGVGPKQPSLNPGFATFGSALSQNSGAGFLPYMTGWVGRWHVSDYSPLATPSSYGFHMQDHYGNDVNLPGSLAFPSPPGCGNEGSNGTDTLDGGPFWETPNPFPLGERFGFISDAYIADWFIEYAIPAMQTASTAGIPWCVTASFINPHDITYFPVGYNLATGAPGSYFGPPATTAPPTAGFNPPPASGGIPHQVDTTSNYAIPPLPKIYTVATLPAGWNVADDPTKQPYLTTTKHPSGKPNLQGLVFAPYTSQTDGSILGCPIGQTCATPQPVAWLVFLNYYLWMQACVDYQIGRVLNAVINGSVGWSNTVIVFTSDHGDYAGSHSLHAKGGALYEESINVPLYVSWPSMRAADFTLKTNTSVVCNFLCSSVDLFPFLYTLARNGDHTWRTGSTYGYLGNREDIYDAIMMVQPQYRRLTSIPVADPSSGSGYNTLPYILHTTDEFNLQNSLSTQPTHVVGIRTLDPSTSPTGGGKLGVYSFWPAAGVLETSYIAQTAGQQFEFYNYNAPANNTSEIGNDYFNPAYLSLVKQYVGAFQGGGLSSIANQQLYAISPAFLAAWQAAWLAYFGQPAPAAPPAYTP